MTDNRTDRSAKVGATVPPKQAEDIHGRWPWVEYTVWTERLLARLEPSEPTTKLANKGCTVWNMALANMHSLPQETTDRKAGCGKSARPVWREGWSSNLHPYPYFIDRQPTCPRFLFVFQRRGSVASDVSGRVLRAAEKQKETSRGRLVYKIGVGMEV